MLAGKDDPGGRPGFDAPRPVLWCLGVAEQRVRPMTDTELNALRSRARRLLSLAIFVPIASLVFPLGLSVSWFSLGLWLTTRETIQG
jgi:hypothetical protein